MRKWLFHLSVSGLILGILFWRARIWQLGDVFADFNPWVGVAVLLLNVPLLLAMTLRSWLVFRRLYDNASFGVLLPIATVGNIAGAFTPANVGDLWRAYIYKQKFAVPTSHGVAMIIYERAMSFYIMAVSAGGIALYQLLLADIGPAILPALGLAVAVVAFLPHLLYPAIHSLGTRVGSVRALEWLFHRWPLRSVRSSLEEGGKTLDLLVRDRLLAATFIGASVLFLGLATLQFWLILSALDLGLGFYEAWFVLGVAGTAGAASSLPFGLGVTDGGLVLLLQTLDVALGPATTAAILLRGLQTLPLGLAAVACYIFLVRGEPSSTEERVGLTYAAGRGDSQGPPA